jgi:hypothetical protein
MLYVFDSCNNPSLFQTGWFVESMLTQTLIIHIIRTAKIPFLQSRASSPLIATSVIICMVGIALPFTPVGRVAGALLVHYRGFPVDLRNPDAFGEDLVRPPLLATRKSLTPTSRTREHSPCRTHAIGSASDRRSTRAASDQDVAGMPRGRAGVFSLLMSQTR